MVVMVEMAAAAVTVVLADRVIFRMLHLDRAVAEQVAILVTEAMAVKMLGSIHVAPKKMVRLDQAVVAEAVVVPVVVEATMFMQVPQAAEWVYWDKDPTELEALELSIW